MHNANNPDDLSVRDAAKILDRHEATIRRYMRLGVRGRQLKYRLNGGQYRTTIGWIQEFLQPRSSSATDKVDAILGQGDVDAELDGLLA